MAGPSAKTAMPYTVDGIDDKLSEFANPDDQGASFNLFKLTTTCVDDMTSSWLELTSN
jgi:phospholipase C